MASCRPPLQRRPQRPARLTGLATDPCSLAENATSTVRAAVSWASLCHHQTSSLLGGPGCAEGPEKVGTCVRSHSCKGDPHWHQRCMHGVCRDGSRDRHRKKVSGDDGSGLGPSVKLAKHHCPGQRFTVQKPANGSCFAGYISIPVVGRPVTPAGEPSQVPRGCVREQNSSGIGPRVPLSLQALTPPLQATVTPTLPSLPCFPTPGRLPGSSLSSLPPWEFPALFDFLTSWGPEAQSLRTASSGGPAPP